MRLSDRSDEAVLRMLMTSRVSALVAAVRRVVPLHPRRAAAAFVVDAHARSARDTRHSSRCVRCDHPGGRPFNRALCRTSVDHSVVIVARLRRARQPGGASSIRRRPHRPHCPARLVARRGRRKQARRVECNAPQPLEPRFDRGLRASWQFTIIQSATVLRHIGALM